MIFAKSIVNLLRIDGHRGELDPTPRPYIPDKLCFTTLPPEEAIVSITSKDHPDIH